MSTIDIIIPCYRYGRYLNDCVHSVLSQSGVEVRALIIDDASPDNTAEVASDIARHDPRVTFLRHVKNCGHIATYNEGIDWASSDFVLVLSADDWLLPNALKLSIRLLEQNPDIGFTFGKTIELRDADNLEQSLPADYAMQKAPQLLKGIEFIRLLQHEGMVNIVPTPTAVVRTHLQKTVGGYRHDLPHSGDLEMWLRLAAHAGVGFIPAYQAVSRRHGANMHLGYLKDKGFADLMQRKAAIDTFCQTSAHLLGNPRHLSAAMLRPIAIDAVHSASRALNDGQAELSAQLSRFALDAFPRIRASAPWMRLAVKRILGRHLSPLMNLLPAQLRRTSDGRSTDPISLNKTTNSHQQLRAK